jgi:hypothetical protein
VAAISVCVFHSLPEMYHLESCAPELAVSVCCMMIVLFPLHTFGLSLVKSIDGEVASGILFIQISTNIGLLMYVMYLCYAHILQFVCCLI